MGAGADGGFVVFLLTGCDRNPWADAPIAVRSASQGGELAGDERSGARRSKANRYQ